MKETIYQSSFKKTLLQSLLPLLPVVLQVAFMIYQLTYLDDLGIELIFINLPFIALSVFSLIILTNYIKNANATKIILRYNTIVMVKNNISIELDTYKIDKVEIHSVTENSRVPWLFMEYYILHQGDRKILFNSFNVEISEFWRDNLARRISTKNIQHHKRWYPMIRE